MNINWFEIVAQMINFLILLFLLNKLFYKPVIKAMEERQERIFKEQNEAEEKMNDANELVATYEDKMAEIDKKEKNILENAKQEALEKKEELIEDYKNEAQKKGNDFLNEIEEEKDDFLKELRFSLGKNAISVATNILSILSEEELKEKVFQSFINKIESMDQEMLKNELPSENKELLLISSEDIPEAQRKKLEKKIKEKIGDFKNISYTVEKDLILGYELNLDTITVHTNIKKYLDEAEKNVVKALEKKSF